MIVYYLNLYQKTLNRYRNAFANKIIDQKGLRDRFLTMIHVLKVL